MKDALIWAAALGLLVGGLVLGFLFIAGTLALILAFILVASLVGGVTVGIMSLIEWHDDRRFRRMLKDLHPNPKDG